MIEVYLDDGECKNFLEPDRWARECCKSYRGVTLMDVTGFISTPANEMAVYLFENSADAAFFTLTWKERGYEYV